MQVEIQPDFFIFQLLQMIVTLIIIFLFCIFIASYLLARRDDKILDLQQRVEFLEQKTNKKIVSRLLFVELKSVNSVLDTLNNCFYLIDKEGDYDIDTEYRLADVTDEWWESLSSQDLEVVNKIKKG
jgi:cell division protein YceG involved in septum cleavage